MSKIDVTEYVKNAKHSDISRCWDELGPVPPYLSWACALEKARGKPMLTTPRRIAALRSWAYATHCWNDGDIAGWTDLDCNAYFCQMVSSDVDELEDIAPDGKGGIDWQKAQELADNGATNGNLAHAKNGRLYYDLNNFER